MNESNLVRDLIKLKVAQGIEDLVPHLQVWLRAHLVEPRSVRLSVDPDGNSSKDLWLVTDHIDEDDASYRIVYDEDSQMFGLESTLETGVEWYMGSYGSLPETVQSM
jgi:hypothetical protein